MDILLGTQMIAKGLDFPEVTLVGVIDADTGLNLPDFRASERTFQLLVQVGGRAGRAERPGRVLIQTLQPEDRAVQAAAAGDLDGFLEEELPWRAAHDYPPFRRLARGDGGDPPLRDHHAVLLEYEGWLDRYHPVGMYDEICLHDALPLTAPEGVK